MTAAEFERIPDDDSFRTELDEGEIVRLSFLGMDEGACGAEKAYIVANYVSEHDLGGVYGANTGFTLRGDTVRAPHLAFVRKSRLAEVHGRGFGKGAPDLAVEIFSPSDSVRQLMRKVKQYFAAGCHTVWIVYPQQREVQILEATGVDRLLRLGDTIEAPEILPGFSSPVAAIF